VQEIQAALFELRGEEGGKVLFWGDKHEKRKGRGRGKVGVGQDIPDYGRKEKRRDEPGGCSSRQSYEAELY